MNRIGPVVLACVTSLALQACTGDDAPEAGVPGTGSATSQTLPAPCGWLRPGEIDLLLGFSTEGAIPSVSDTGCIWILDTPDGSGTVPGRTGNAQVEVAAGPAAVELANEVEPSCDFVPLLPEGMEACWDGRALSAHNDTGAAAYVRVEGLPTELAMPLARQLVVAALTRSA